MNKPPTLILIRGLPGSGKSTLAKKIIEDGRADPEHQEHYACFEADMYFHERKEGDPIGHGSGEYKFDPKKIGDAHAWCQHETKRRLSQGINVIVSNTFTTKWELEPYVKMAKELGAKIEIMETKGNFQNVHGVPEATITKMAARWESLPENFV